MTQLVLHHIKKTFGRGTAQEINVLNNLSLTLNKGDFVTVIGGNGAGKSTMMNVIMGIVKQDVGQVSIAGKDVSLWQPYKRAELVGCVFQDTTKGTASRLTIAENLSLALQRGEKRKLKKGINRDMRLLMKEQLKTLDLGLENFLDKDMQTLSGGQRQAVTLLMATLKKPELLLLDEHTAALDPKTSEIVLRLTNQVIARDHLTALMVTHNMEDALKYGNRLIMLHKGEVVLDFNQAEKETLSVIDLINLFKEKVGSYVDDTLLLS